MVSALAEITVHELHGDEDFVVLACDGIWNSLDNQQVDMQRTYLHCL